jgi:hypothetical protein
MGYIERAGSLMKGESASPQGGAALRGAAASDPPLPPFPPSRRRSDYGQHA